METVTLPEDGNAILTVFRRYGNKVHALRRMQWPDGITLCGRASSQARGEWFLYDGPVTCKICARQLPYIADDIEDLPYH